MSTNCKVSQTNAMISLHQLTTWLGFHKFDWIW